MTLKISTIAVDNIKIGREGTVIINSIDVNTKEKIKQRVKNEPWNKHCVTGRQEKR